MQINLVELEQFFSKCEVWMNEWMDFDVMQTGRKIQMCQNENQK